ncbi:MAG: Lipoprotein signal peptidase [Candidatus Peregrinibacteria bacterium GW2011_GWA2_47_7]|nr:MAG: Lipoprotein signal peptidase [Candidatus Peregrinibacteria bacterium GW2011_GWA2_47_7]
MPSNSNTKFWIFCVSAIADVILFDQIAKWAARKFLTEPIEVIPNFLELATHQNPAVAFSLPIPNAVMLFLTPIILSLLLIFLIKSVKHEAISGAIAFGYLIGGGASNWIDRLLFNSVTDFIAFSFWPVFNLADAFITVGAFMLIIGARVAPSNPA